MVTPMEDDDGMEQQQESRTFDSYHLVRTIGEGEFGKVKLAIHMQTGKEYAIKLVRKSSLDTPLKREKIKREIQCLRALDHPFIVRLVDYKSDKDYVGLIMEYASGGELFEHILAHQHLSEKSACRFFVQLICGVHYFHSHNIVHRDLKLENLLLDENRNVIITDFGFANLFGSAMDKQDLLKTSCGSPCYAAPELVTNHEGYTGEAADIWSCGVILYAMLCGYLPFDDDPNNPEGNDVDCLYLYISTTELNFPDWVSEQAKNLLRMILVPDPRYRAGMQQIMIHPWCSPCVQIMKESLDYTKRSMEAAALQGPRSLSPLSFIFDSPPPDEQRQLQQHQPQPQPQSTYQAISHMEQAEGAVVPTATNIEESSSAIFLQSANIVPDMPVSVKSSDADRPVSDDASVALKKNSSDADASTAATTAAVIVEAPSRSGPPPSAVSTSVEENPSTVINQHTATTSSIGIAATATITPPPLSASSSPDAHVAIPDETVSQYQEYQVPSSAAMDVVIEDADHYSEVVAIVSKASETSAAAKETLVMPESLSSEITPPEKMAVLSASSPPRHEHQQHQTQQDYAARDMATVASVSRLLSQQDDEIYIVGSTLPPLDKSSDSFFIPSSSHSATIINSQHLPLTPPSSNNNISSSPSTMEQASSKAMLMDQRIPPSALSFQPVPLGAWDGQGRQSFSEDRVASANRMVAKIADDMHARKSFDVRRISSSAEKKDKGEKIKWFSRKKSSSNQQQQQDIPSDVLHEELMDFDGSSPQMSAISPESKESATSPQSANQRILESQWQPGRKSLSINDSSSRPMQPLKLRYHSGPIDHRALTNRFPTELIQDIQAIVRENGMMIRSSASESTSFKLKVVRPRQIVTVSQPVEQAQMKLGSSGSNSSLFQNQQQFMEDVYPVSRDPDAMSTHSRSSATSRHQQRPIRPDVGIKRVVRVSDDDSLSNNNTNRSNASFAAADKSGSNNNNASSRFARVISSLPMSLIRRVKYMAKHGSSWNKGFDGSTEDASRRFEVAGNHHETASCSTPEDMSMQQIEDELRFYIEIQKIKNLKGLYVVEFKRRNGDIWLFKKMYQELLAQLPLGESDIF